MSTIRLILFDLGGVVINWDDNWLYRYVAEKWGVEESLLISECNKMLSALHSGRIDEFEYWSDIAEKTNPKYRINMKESFIDRVFNEKATLNDETFRLISNLKAQGFKVGVLSNLEKRAFEILNQWRIFSDFDYVFASFVIGLTKPTPEVYRYILKNTPFAAHEILLIDDKESNVLAATKEGMQGIIFHNMDYLNQELLRIKSSE